MEPYMSRRWLVIVIVVWLVVMAADELIWAWWKRENPGSSWQGLFVNPHPLSGTSYSNQGQTTNGSAFLPR